MGMPSSTSSDGLAPVRSWFQLKPRRATIDLRGEVTIRLFPKTGSYALGLDLDLNGAVDRV